MLLERAADHYRGRGWNVEASPTLRQGALVFKPDLVARRGSEVRALRVDDDPLGSYPIGAFAALCKKFRLQGVVVCPASQDVIDSCEDRGVEFLSAEGLGEAWFPGVPAPAPEPASASPLAAAPVAAQELSSRTAVPAWRWVVVAIIWLAAIYFSVKLALEILA
ncbi:MAG: hypothetical protein HYT80_09125 [Euryarchaeota archaeon]|nr:hypothetical protein [Euryarchaeota archaeon]